VASERGTAQTVRMQACRRCTYWVVGPSSCLGRSSDGHHAVSRAALGRPAKEGDSPVDENQMDCGWHLSTTGHEKPCWKLGRPFPKAKYYLVTDSEPVP
jgi:hypothetical protein